MWTVKAEAQEEYVSLTSAPGYDSGGVKLDPKLITPLPPQQGTPLFKHDCDECKFYGTIMFDGVNGDVWLHERNNGRASLIHRDGSDPPEYQSFPIFSIQWDAQGEFNDALHPLMTAVYGAEWRKALVAPASRVRRWQARGGVE